MYPREYSLKTRYNFRRVYQQGETFHTEHLLIKYLKVDPRVFEDASSSETSHVNKKFAVVTSNRFHKQAVVQNRVRRVISEALRLRLDKFPPNCYYVIIPKKNVLVKGKPNVHTDQILSELDTFLSKVVVS